MTARPLAPRPARSAVIPGHLIGRFLVIAVEVMFFAALVSAYLVARGEAVVWPPVGQPRLPVARTAINTVVLLLSGWLAWRALIAKDDDPPLGARLLGWAAAGGALFLGLQGYEWLRLIDFGLRSDTSLYGAFFYLIVGAHAAHVLAGIVAIGVVSRWGRRSEPVAGAAVFWLFVVALWPALYWLVYLR
ncbi:MAG: heme-copper oxidase subunit III [Gemmatimonadales bacterium]|nr:heme-copper oxidase subunit III [Gemmatimonadales bacterium]